MASALAQKFMMFALLLGVVGITCWSWVLIDPNFTLLNHLDWARFRELMISIGYYNRQLSSQLFVGLIIWISVFSYLVVRFYRKSLSLPIIFIGVVAGLVSYPALSHDLFNYIFDARIVTYYHANPYLLRAMDFGADPMIRFMHWIHRTYPYGPSYLLISLIPSFLGFGVFSLTFFLFKLLHVGLYILSSLSLVKLNRKAAIIFITSPLIIVEGLINTHNDFVAVALAIIGIYLLSVQRNRLSALLLLTSGLIKYVTLPLVILIKIKPLDTLLIKLKHKFVWLKTIKSWHIAFVGTLALVTYLSLHMEVQPWYFLNLFIFVVYIPNFFRKFWIAIFGLVLCYYPYVIGGQWGQGGDVDFKRKIILAGILINVTMIICAKYLLPIWKKITWYICHKFHLRNKIHRIHYLISHLAFSRWHIITAFLIGLSAILFIGVVIPFGHFSCYRGSCGLYFLDMYRARDDLWHISLATSAFKSYPFVMPIFEGASLQGYHFLFAYIVFLLSKTGINIFFLYYKIIPVIWFILYTFVSIVFANRLWKNKISTFFFLLFQFFGGSLSYVFSLFHHQSFWSTSGYFVNQPGEYFYNLPFATSMLVFMIALYILAIGKHSIKHFATLAVLLFCVWGLKFYGGCILLLIIGSFYVFSGFAKKISIHKLVIALMAIFASTLLAIIFFYDPFKSTQTGSIFSFRPFANTQAFIEVPDLFFIYKLAVARYYAYAHMMPYVYLPIQLFTLVVFIVFTFGTRLIGLIEVLNYGKKRSITPFFAACLTGLVGGLFASILLVQRGSEWFNTIQFLAYALFLSGIFATITCRNIWVSVSIKYQIFFALLIIGLMSHQTINAFVKSTYWIGKLNVVYAFTPANYLTYISTSELKALDYLQSKPDGVVFALLLKSEARPGKTAFDPVNLSRTNDTAYISALTGKQVYYANTEQLSITGVSYLKRLNTMKNIQTYNPLQNRVRYYYLLKWHKDYATMNDQLIKYHLKQVYDNNEVRIYE